MEAKLETILRREIPGCRSLLSAERLSGGASQETYRLTIALDGDGEHLLAMRRAPGGQPSAATSYNPGLAAEALLMQSARAVGVPEPEVHYVLRDSDGLGEGFIMSWLEGEALGARIVRSPELAAVRPKLAYECGQILARIHAIDLAATGLDGQLKTMTPESYVHNTWDRYKGFRTPHPMIDYTAQWLLQNLPNDVEMALVHNDFRNGNLMISPNGVAAVLDWEVAHIGDPMRDLGWICTNSWRFGSDLPVGGFGTYDDLFAGYESISGQAVDGERVKFWEVFGSFWWAIGCLSMAEHYRTGPDNTVERPAIGRRSSECQVDCVNLLIPGPVSLVQADAGAGDEMPRIDELLTSVRDFLRGDVMDATTARTNFMARVAGNSLDIVLRDQALGPEHRHLEYERLQALLGIKESLEALRWRLTNGLRAGDIPLDHPGLAEHLRQSVVNQIAIDQPKYSGFKTAIQ
ncbi:MAG: phosphotransferase family protein [Rhodospirillaceae bacterium]|nr:phosphotransferase family protein [Rhodospirillaceae bacterium]MBT5192321.1 phosphotransferase family protein [Rhodospirillaceae bacterium]MBT5896233.1 phosphotransferase family protein [Rhodospirillaceae bacterium]MBT6430408.1 phosphotransferase family protein [Rhodospirillaceae bacterium]MBT7760057.1 phosphotransferase family protein [Rhodospirillaceae bacterium]